jgi:hypothetical protein
MQQGITLYTSTHNLYTSAKPRDRAIPIAKTLHLFHRFSQIPVEPVRPKLDPSVVITDTLQEDIVTDRVPNSPGQLSQLA